ncbi:WSC domain-containing protein 2 [Serendipita sp. 407]|nr:WSC domain-containing protein 2 [Serendipita sp. 407]
MIACTSTYSVTEATTCTTPCKGDDKQMCGGSGGGVSVYYKPSDQVPLTSPVASNVWQNQGCYSAYGPAYVTPVMDVTDFYRMDVGKCTGFCFAMGKPVAAISSTTQTFGGSTQERQVCACGDVLPSTPADDSSCNKSCTADRFQYCGGQTTYSIYKSVAPSTTYI